MMPWLWMSPSNVAATLPILTFMIPTMVRFCKVALLIVTLSGALDWITPPMTTAVDKYTGKPAWDMMVPPVLMTDPLRYRDPPLATMTPVFVRVVDGGEV